MTVYGLVQFWLSSELFSFNYFEIGQHVLLLRIQIKRTFIDVSLILKSFCMSTILNNIFIVWFFGNRLVRLCFFKLCWCFQVYDYEKAGLSLRLVPIRLGSVKPGPYFEQWCQLARTTRPEIIKYLLTKLNYGYVRKVNIIFVIVFSYYFAFTAIWSSSIPGQDYYQKVLDYNRTSRQKPTQWGSATILRPVPSLSFDGNWPEFSKYRRDQWRTDSRW